MRRAHISSIYLSFSIYLIYCIHPHPSSPPQKKCSISISNMGTWLKSQYLDDDMIWFENKNLG